MSLLDRLSLSRKFLVLGLIALVMAALPTFLHVSRSMAEIRTAQLEVRGMPPLMAVQAVVQYMQQHRGLSSGMLSGNAALKERRPGVRDKVNQAIAAVQDQLRLAGASAAVQEQWSQRQQRWQALEQAVASERLLAADSTRQHSQLIASVLNLNPGLMNEFGLTLDTDMDTHELMQASFISAPWLTEKLGIMRAMGSGFLTQGNLPPQSKGTLMSLKDRADELHGEWHKQFSHAASLNPVFDAKLKAAAQALEAQIDKTLKLADQELINAAELKLPATQYFDEFTRTIDAVYQFNAQAMGILEQALQDRVDDHHRKIALILGLQLVGSVAAVGLALVFVRSITVPIESAVQVAKAVSGGDLTARVPSHGSNEIGQLLDALSAMQTNLKTLVSTVRKDADGVATASAQIAQGNNDLSARTEEGASALQQTTASMEQLNSHVRDNADHAREANGLAHQAREVAVRGGGVVNDVVHTMREINQASSRIADIIGVIDGIAFQTNILALNAAVEAARAGEQGRGFAVVASEVRSLAGRSAEAAKEIKQLISNSVERVQQGSLLVDQAGQTMDDVVGAIKRVTDLMEDISNASAAQSISVAEVGQAINQLDQSMQQNAALVEQSAAAADSMRQQAQELVESVSVFRT